MVTALALGGAALTAAPRANACDAQSGEVESRLGAYAGANFGFAYGGWRASGGLFTGEAWSEALQVSAALGWAFVDGLAFAGEARALWQGGSTSLSPDNGLSDPFVSVLGGLVDYYPSSRSMLHVQVGFGAMTADFSATTIGYGEPVGGIYHSRSGVFGHTGVGWALPLGRTLFLGPTFSLYRGRASSGPGRADFYGGSLDLSLTYL